MQRHHGALAEAHQGEVAIGQSAPGELRVEERLQDLRRHPHAAQLHLRRAVLQPEPLEAERRQLAREGRVGRQELRLRQRLREKRCEADQVVAVRP
jgi:hypothetical protein